MSRYGVVKGLDLMMSGQVRCGRKGPVEVCGQLRSGQERYGQMRNGLNCNRKRLENFSI